MQGITPSQRILRFLQKSQALAAKGITLRTSDVELSSLIAVQSNVRMLKKMKTSNNNIVFVLLPYLL
jgi:hypothetical protein